MRKRKYIYGRIRREIWERFKGQCNQCGICTKLFRKQVGMFDGTRLAAIDHIKPFSVGGECLDDNFQLLCETCNSQKGAKYAENC